MPRSPLPRLPLPALFVATLTGWLQSWTSSPLRPLPRFLLIVTTDPALFHQKIANATRIPFCGRPKMSRHESCECRGTKWQHWQSLGDPQGVSWQQHLWASRRNRPFRYGRNCSPFDAKIVRQADVQNSGWYRCQRGFAIYGWSSARRLVGQRRPGLQAAPISGSRSLKGFL